MTAEFLEFSKSRGNDLSTPMPQFGFPGLRPGDRWCLCAERWQEALEADQAPRVVLRATHEGALDYCALASSSGSRWTSPDADATRFRLLLSAPWATYLVDLLPGGGGR